MPSYSVERALRVAQLALFPQSWIRRRVEQVSYLDESMVRRRISIDFVVPPFPLGPPEGSDVPLPLPLALFAKRKLTRFDLRSAAGIALPMYTAAENGAISSAVLHALADVRGLGYRDPVLDRAIDLLVLATTDTDRDFALNRIFDQRITLGRHLRGQADFATLARDVADNFVLYLPAPAVEIGHRQIIKLCFDSSERAPRAEGILERLGWREAVDNFVVPLAGFAQSYHFEIDAPPEMAVTKGALLGIRDRRVVHDDVREPVPCAHFNLAGLDRLPGRVFVGLKTRSRDLLGAILILALANLAAQGVVLWRLHPIRVENKAEAVVAALVALPGVLLTYLVRPGEHRVLATFLRDVRRAGLLCGITSMVAAIVIFAGFREDPTKWTLIGLLVIAGTCVLLLTGSWLGQRAT